MGLPYLGDLVGIRPVAPGTKNASPQRQVAASRLLFPRRDVADAIKFERRKGTLAVLEELARATANWPARAVEYYALINTFQSAGHIDDTMGRTIDLRDRDQLQRVDTAFNTAAHLVDARMPTQPSVRTFGSQGLFHPIHVGLLIWRLGSYRIWRGATRCVCAKNGDNWQLRLHTFDSFGLSAPLSIKPVEETDENHIAGEENVPGPLTLRAFTTAEGSVSEQYYGPDKSVEVWTNRAGGPLQFEQPDRIVPADLSWLLRSCCGGRGSNECEARRLELVKRLINPIPSGEHDWNDWKVAVDPEHGLLAFAGLPESLQKIELYATYHYSFSADMGGGEYQRPSAPQGYSASVAIRRIRSGGSPQTANVFTLAGNQISQPIDDGRGRRIIRPHAIIEVADDDTYQLGAERIIIPSGVHLEIRAAQGRRPTIELCDTDACEPALIVELGKAARLTLDGLRVFGGKVVVQTWHDDGATPLIEPMCPTDQMAAAATLAQASRIDVKHCTLLPNPTHEAAGCKPSQPVSIEFHVADGRLAIHHSVVGSLNISTSESHRPARVSIDDSIVDGQAADCELAIGGATGSILRISRSTVIGRTRVQELDLAADTIFTRDVEVRREQLGGMRFCYVPPSEIREREPELSWKTPQQYYCQPSQAHERQGFRKQCGDIAANPAQTAWEAIEPIFSSLRYGDPSYCQLTLDCPREIREGAEDGSEMGAFHDLFQPQREQALSRRVEEFTPLSLRTSLIFVN